MAPNSRRAKSDEWGLIVIGCGAAGLYILFETIIGANQMLTIYLTVGLILLTSVFTQLLINSLNRTTRALRDVNEHLEVKVRERTDELRRSEALYRTIFEHTGAATIIIDRDMTIVLANSVFIALAGYAREEIEQHKRWMEFIDEKSQRRLISEGVLAQADQGDGTAVRNLECYFIDRHGSRRETVISFAPIPGGERWVASMTDIAELKEAERQLRHQAFHDALTGLPNRVLFMEHLSMSMKRGRRREEYLFAVLYLDIDRFKLVNDGLGHGIGDKLLVAFSRKLRAQLRDIDILARLGGDEFVILLEDIDNSDYAMRVADRLQEALRVPFEIEGHIVFAPASFGIVVHTKDYERPEEIIRDADVAMYHAKEQGRASFKVFDRKLHEKALKNLQLETDLRRAIDKHEFEVHYQPIVALERGNIIGLEALIRWLHPQQGLIYPDAFIPMAEDTGLILPIGRWVLQQACSDLRRWQDQLGGNMPLFISVNISSKQFLRPTIVSDIQEILNRTGLRPEQLKLEITETALMDDAEETIRIVRRLRDFGIQIVIDDFGTGYSSMSYLQRLPIDTLKVDRTFISLIKDQPDENRSIVETIISLARRLDLNVVAEGVETAEQQSVLSAMNCQHAQGFLFSRPLDRHGMQRLIANFARVSQGRSDMSCALSELLPEAPAAPETAAPCAPNV
jgi:diguanylate cyclase (GGDEF)-like protein/PAS domain S-box-containing protein